MTTKRFEMDKPVIGDYYEVAGISFCPANGCGKEKSVKNKRVIYEFQCECGCKAKIKLE